MTWKSQKHLQSHRISPRKVSIHRNLTCQLVTENSGWDGTDHVIITSSSLKYVFGCFWWFRNPVNQLSLVVYLQSFAIGFLNIFWMIFRRISLTINRSYSSETWVYDGEPTNQHTSKPTTWSFILDLRLFDAQNKYIINNNCINCISFWWWWLFFLWHPNPQKSPK